MAVGCQFDYQPATNWQPNVYRTADNQATNKRHPFAYQSATRRLTPGNLTATKGQTIGRLWAYDQIPVGLLPFYIYKIRETPDILSCRNCWHAGTDGFCQLMVCFAFGFLRFCLSIFIYIKNLPEGRLGLLLFLFTFPFQ